MLSNAGESHASWLRAIASQSAEEWPLVRGLTETSLRQNTLTLYAASYALIRVGNMVADHSRDLEIIYPDYAWVYWVDLRNRLAHQPNPTTPLDAGEVWVAISQSLPELIQVITGEPPAL